LARKILLADDSVTAQNMGRKILADAGYEVITVNNGSAALKKIAEVKPDLIVLDVYMPGYSGLEVCQRLKEAPETSRIPVLLTVGKLEPFKPEEAKRVRAEGFIVKPFEASELLSALAKLEDKMVPRGESSKPGRFARTIAAVEEGRHDKTVAAEEDSGWKSRINFPSKKKEKAQREEENDEAAIYNPVNKDLRTVLEPKPSAVVPAAKTPAAEAEANQSRVDVTALSPAGLPKDVTAEEIAALAAAAAQIQGKLAETKAGDAKAADGPGADAKIQEFQTIAPPQEDAIATAKVEDKVEVKAEAVAEVKDQAQPAAVESASVVAASEPVTAAVEQKPEEKRQEVREDKPFEAAAAHGTASSVSGESFASMGISEAVQAAPSRTSSNGDGLHDPGQKAEPEPVTMAVAAAAASGGYSSPSRWTAVSVALAPEESAIALEDEMRKAYAAYSVSTESRPVEAASSLAETKPVESTITPEVLTAIPATNSASIFSIPAAPAEPETAREVSSVVSGTGETTYPAVKNFEAVSTSRFHGQATEAPAESIPVQASVPEPPAIEASVMEEPKSAEAVQTGAISSEAQPAESSKIDAKDETVSASMATPEPVAAIDSASSHDEGPKYSEEMPRNESIRDEIQDSVVPAQAASAPAIPDSASSLQASSVQEMGFSEPDTHPAAEPVASAPDEETTTVAKPASKSAPTGDESNIAASTAAAWASWRRIRESGDPKGRRDSGEESRDEASMAVAAGAEKAPELQEGPEIASIVDSVLADLRPKIVEEISKKLKKK
jgi:CheY-like chemotaxis protein